MRCAKFQWLRSLRSRLLLAYGIGIVFSALLVGAGIVAFIKPVTRYLLEYGAIGYAEEVARRIYFDHNKLPAGIDETKVEQWLFTSLSEEVTVRVVDARGRVYFSPTGATLALVPEGAAFDPDRKGFALDYNGVPMHVGTVPLRHDGTTWYVQFGVSDRLVLRMRESVGLPVLYQGLFAICVTFLVVFLITTHVTLRRMLRPLQTASLAAQRITPQTLDARLDVQDLPDDIAPLVVAFNQALERLQSGFRAQQDFLANAAHELKTPLSLIRAEIELNSSDQRNHPLIQDVDRMARQVQQLLQLAEASELHNYRMEDVDPRSILKEVCGYMSRTAKSRDVEIDFEYRGAFRFWTADRGALFTLFKNLLENAIQHSPAGSIITLAATAAGFVVADQGAGVKPDEYEKIFQRFWRGPARRDIGAGLGLSICREIAQAHGWRIQARRGTVGLEVHVLMPEGQPRSEVGASRRDASQPGFWSRLRV